MWISRNVLKVATGVGAATIVCKSLAALQQLLLARTLGATEMADAFFLAQILPVLLGGLLYNALSSNVVVLLAMLPDQQERGALLSGILIQLGLVMFCLALSIFGLSRHMLPHSDEPQHALLRDAGRIQSMLLPMLVLQPVSGVLAGTLQSAGRVIAPPVTMALPYAGGLLGLCVTTAGSPYPLTVGLVGGCILQLLALLASAHHTGVRLASPAFGYGAKLFRLTLPGLGCNAISTLYLVSDRSFAATFGPGQVAAISYIYSIVTMPTQILVNTVVGVSLPRWAQLSGNRPLFVQSTSKALALVCLSVIPIALFLSLAAAPLTDALLGAAHFQADQRGAIATLLSAFAITTVGFAAKDTLTAALISQGTPQTALASGLASLALAVPVRSLLTPHLGIAASAVATAAGLGVCVCALLLAVSRGGSLNQFWNRSRIAFIAALPAAVVGMQFASPVTSVALALTTYGIAVASLGFALRLPQSLGEQIER